MKNKSKKIIKTLLLSATVALFHGTAKADAKKSFSLDLDLGLPNGGAAPEVSKGQQPIVKNVYKILRNGDAKLIAGHRSHSSHRSSRGGHYSQVVIAVIAAIAVPVVAHTIPTVQVLMVVEVDHLYIHPLQKRQATTRSETVRYPRAFMGLMLTN